MLYRKAFLPVILRSIFMGIRLTMKRKKWLEFSETYLRR